MESETSDSADEQNTSTPWAEAFVGSGLTGFIALISIALFSMISGAPNQYEYLTGSGITIVIMYVAGYFSHLLYLLECERATLKEQANEGTNANRT